MNEGELVIALLICATVCYKQVASSSYVYINTCTHIMLFTHQIIAASNWEIEIHFHQYNNPTGEKSNGQCCSACVCEPEFRVCLQPGYYDLNKPNRCPYNNFEELTSMSVSTNFIEFNNTINDIDNPIIFSAGGELQEVSV